jgi:fructose/tagatose bisphosphate aldolase
MPLVSFSELVAQARCGGYAVGYFEPWDLRSLLAILRGAEQARAPVIVGFSGIYLPPSLGMELRHFAPFARAGRIACENASVPTAYLFNETPYWDWALASLELGFNVTMYSNPRDDAKTHVERTAALVQRAAAAGVEVQAEVGSLEDDAGYRKTDPAEAADFVRRTRVHALGVVAGNRYETTGKFDLDLDLIARLAEAVPVPLVLHGGTGARDDQLREAAARGVAQVNFGAVQRLVFLERLEDALRDWRSRDPHEVLGTGYEDDVLRPGLEAVSALVAEKCIALGAAGRATSNLVRSPLGEGRPAVHGRGF